MENREHLKEKKIAIITSDLQGSEAVRQVLHTMHITCPVIYSGLGALPSTAKEQVRRGAGVIIAFGMFAKIVRQNVDVPVIMVDICPEDVLDGIGYSDSDAGRTPGGDRRIEEG